MLASAGMATQNQHAHHLDVLAYMEHCRTLRRMLARVQWSRTIPRQCPECSGDFPDHHDECELDATLAIRIDDVGEVTGAH